MSSYNDLKGFDTKDRGINYCHNFLYEADKDSTLQLPHLDDPENKIREVLSIPVDEWEKIVKNLDDCYNRAEDKAYFSYYESLCYTKAAYKILRFCLR